MNNNTPTIGIIGGFGPDTSALFCKQLVECALTIQPELPPAFIVDFVSVSPDIAHGAIAGSTKAGKSLIQSINSSIQRLHSTGVEYVALPCNTLHAFSDAFMIPMSTTLIHIVDCVIEEIARRQLNRVMLLATQLTVSSGLYATPCLASNIECQNPSPRLQEKLSLAIAHYVKTGCVSNDTQQTFRLLFAECELSGIKAVIFGCTDLFDMFVQSKVDTSLEIIDSTGILARKCATICTAK